MKSRFVFVSILVLLFVTLLIPFMLNVEWPVAKSNSGTESTAPYIGEDGYWYVNGAKTEYKAQGVNGGAGNGIVSIEKTATNGNVDTYTITFDNGETTTFTITNGVDGTDGTDGTDTSAQSYTVSYIYNDLDDCFETTPDSVTVSTTVWLSGLPKVKSEYRNFFLGWYIENTDVVVRECSFIGGNVTLEPIFDFNGLVSALGSQATMQAIIDNFNSYGFDIIDYADTLGTDTKVLMWDSVNNLLCYYVVDEDDYNYLGYRAKLNTTDADYFAIYHAEDVATLISGDTLSLQSIDRSVYLVQDATLNGLDISTDKGIDVGEIDGITNISYVNNSATSRGFIRTNSNDTTLTINTNGVVSHHGEVGVLNIIKVATSSYHEYGRARSATIASGRLVVEDEGVVTLLVADAGVNVENTGIIEAYVGTPVVTGSQPTLVTNEVPSDETVAIVKGVDSDEAVTELPATLTDATIILLKDYDYDKPQVIISGNTTIYGNMTKLNAKVTGDDSHIILKNVHTTGIKVGDNNGFSGTLEFDGGQLDYDGVNFSNGENAAFYARTGYGTYRFRNMTVSTGTNKGIKISKAKEVLIENCTFDARLLDREGMSGTGQDEVYNRSLSCIDIQVQNGSLGAMDIVIRGNTFVNIPKGSWTNDVVDTDSAGAIKLKTEAANSLRSVIIEGNTFTNCYRDIVVGVNIRLTTGYSNLNFPAKNPATLKDEQNNVHNATIFTIRNNTTTLTATEVANRGVLVIDDQRVNPKRAYAENVGEIMGGCAVFNTYNSAVITLDTTIADIDALFE